MDLEDDTALICSLSGLSNSQTKALEMAGWNVMRLATLVGCPREMLEAVRWRVQEKVEGFDIRIEDLRELAKRSPRHKWDAVRGGQELLDAHIAHQRRVRRKTFDDVVEEDVVARVSLVGS